MKQEYILGVIIGLLILAYVLDAVVNPLSLRLPTPYHYFDPETVTKYTFTTTSIVIKSIALIMAPLWFLSFLYFDKLVKGAIILVLSGLMQLYAFQDVATNAQVIPLEWSLSLTLTGVVLLLPAVLYFIGGMFGKVHKSFAEDEEFELTSKDSSSDTSDTTA